MTCNRRVLPALFLACLGLFVALPCLAGVGPVADWRFDESSWSGAQNEVRDSSGNGHHGRAVDASPTTGKICNSADFTANSASDRIILDHQALDDEEDVSVSVWVKTRHVSGRAVLSAANRRFNNEFLFWFHSNTQFRPHVHNAHGTESVPGFNDDQWHHLVWVRDGDDDDGESCIYIDGVDQGCTSTRGGDLDIDAGGLILGQEQDSVGGSFDINQAARGLIDELLIFDRKLSGAEVADIYRNQNAGRNWDGSSRNCAGAGVDTEASLLAYYDFEGDWETSGTLSDQEGIYHARRNNRVARVPAPAADNKPDTCSAADLNGGTFDIDGLAVSTADGDAASVSFWMKWDGATGKMPFGWYAYDLWFRNSSQFGFNSSNSDVHGINPGATGLRDHWRHVVAVFRNGGDGNRLYIDGVEQEFSVDHRPYRVARAVVGPNARIGGWRRDNGYRYTGLIDELKVYDGAVTQEQVTADFEAIPDCADDGGEIPAAVAEYRFDGDWLDTTDNDFDGTARGATHDTGQICEAATFDGSTYVEVANDTSLEVGSGDQDFSVTYWMNLDEDSTGRWRGIMHKGSADSTRTFSMWLRPHDRRIHFRISTTSSWNEGSDSSAQVPLDQWTHVAYVKRGRLLELYLNGELDRSVTLRGQVQSNAGPIYWGKDPWYPGFSGRLDEISITPGALSAGQVQAIYTNQAAGNNSDGSPRECPSGGGDCRFQADWGAVASQSLVVQRDVTMNGVEVSGSGNTIAADGRRGTLNSALAAFEPAAMPANDSETDISVPGNQSVSVAAGYYRNITQGRGGELTFSSPGGVYHIDSLTVRRLSTIRFSAGTYYIRNLVLERSTVPVMPDTGEVRVFVGNSAVLQRGVVFNDGGEPGRLQVYAFDGTSVVMERGARFTGIVYSTSDTSSLTLQRNVHFSGMFAVGNATLERNVALSFATAELDGVSMSCPDEEDDTVEIIGDWRVDEADWTAASAVIDSSTNGFHGSAHNGASVLMCGGGSAAGLFDGEDDYVEVADTDALSPQVDGRFTVGAWIKVDAVSGSRGYRKDVSKPIISKFPAGQPTDAYEWDFKLQGDRVYLVMHQDGGSTHFNASFALTSLGGGDSGGTCWDGATHNECWHFIAIAYDRDNGKATHFGVRPSLDSPFDPDAANVRSYYDLVDAAFVGEPVVSTSPVRLGRSDTPWGTTYFDGLLRGAFVARGVMSEEELLARARLTWPGDWSCRPQIDHIRILHDGEGLTCAPETVTVQACVDSSCASRYEEPVSLTLSPTGWVGGDLQTFATGQGEFQLQQLGVSNLALAVSSVDPAPENPLRCYRNGVEGDCSLSFAAAQLSFDVPDLTACKDSAIITLHAGTAGVCGGSFSGARDIRFWSSYQDPATGTANLSINGIAIGRGAPGTAVPVTFNDQGRATFTLNYPDAGQLRLDASYSGSGDEAGLEMSGDDSFVVRPAGLAIYTEAAGAEAQPPNASATRFVRAGESFDLKVKAACWTSDSDTDLSDNPATPNFRLNGVTIGHSLLAPADAAANPGELGTDSIDMSNGETGFSQTVSEVGVFTFSATAPAYFGQALPAVESKPVGRFFPAAFQVSAGSAPTFAPACAGGSGFTYMDQWFDYETDPSLTVSAINTDGVTTANYSGDFWKLDMSLDGRTYVDGASPVEGNGYTFTWDTSAATVTVEGLDVFDGRATATLSGERFAYARNTMLLSPFDAMADLQLQVGDLRDSDGVCFDADGDGGCDGYSFEDVTGTELRFGRLTLRPAHGSHLLSLPMVLRAEHFDGGTFVPNRDDSCTVLGGSPAGFANWTDNLSAYAALHSHNAVLVQGDGGLVLAAPGGTDDDPRNGTVDVTIDAPLWLEFDGDGIDADGDGIPYDDDPAAQATFGIFEAPGDGGIQIYLQEQY